MASDSEEIEYQSFDNRQSKNVQHLPLSTSESPNDEDNESEISYNEEHAFMVHMSPDTNKCKYWKSSSSCHYKSV